MGPKTRRYRFLSITICAAICCLTAPPATSGRDVRPPLEYAYPDQSVWTTRRTPDGVLVNPLLKVADELFSGLGVSWSATPYPANRMFHRLETGQSDFSILVQAPRLKTGCIFSEKPITYIELRIYRKPGSSPITKPEDLKNKRIITILGYSYGKLADYLDNTTNNITTYKTPRHEFAFQMLGHGRAEYLLNYAGPSEEVLVENPIEGITYDVFKRVNVHLVLSKHYPNARELMDKLEEKADLIDVTQWGLERP